MNQHRVRPIPERITPPERYTFGDNAVAADRLALLAATYEPSSAALLRMCASLAPRRAIDLGCGPGHSTRLLHAVVGPGTTLGLDRSAEHIARARTLAPPGIAYAVHDVTAGPFPGGGRPDLLYARFLLTHLRDPAGVLAGWATAADQGSALVLEETLAIGSSDPTLGLYYRLVARLQRHYGQDLEIGRVLDRVAAHAGWRIEIDLTRELTLPAARMARLHQLNLARWREDPFARAAFPPDRLAELATALGAIGDGAAGAAVRHSMRQLVLTRAS